MQYKACKLTCQICNLGRPIPSWPHVMWLNISAIKENARIEPLSTKETLMPQGSAGFHLRVPCNQDGGVRWWDAIAFQIRCKLNAISCRAQHAAVGETFLIWMVTRLMMLTLMLMMTDDGDDGKWNDKDDDDEEVVVRRSPWGVEVLHGQRAAECIVVHTIHRPHHHPHFYHYQLQNQQNHHHHNHKLKQGKRLE